MAGGNAGTPAFSNATEEWDNSSWTVIADINTARSESGYSGTAAAGVIAAAAAAETRSRCSY